MADKKRQNHRLFKGCTAGLYDDQNAEQANQKCRPAPDTYIFSQKNAEDPLIKSGAIKKIAKASANGKAAKPTKKAKFAATTLSPRKIWRDRRRIENMVF